MKNETERPAEQWKRKAAMAIGRPELANEPDEVLEKAHDAHMTEVYRLSSEGGGNLGSAIRDDMPPGPASVANERPVGLTNDGAAITNEKQRGVVLESLMNEAVHRQGITRDDARRQLRTLRPELFPKPIQHGPTSDQIRARDERSKQILSLVNEKMEGGLTEYDLAFRAVRREHPELFPTPKPSKK